MDSQKSDFRAVLKRGMFQKWSAIPVSLMLIAVIAVGGFLGIRALGNHDTPNVPTEPSGNISTAPIDSTVPMDSSDTIDYEQEYADVPEYLRDQVILYARALYENWPQEDWERIGLCSELYLVKEHVECGFVLKDGDSQLYQIYVTSFWADSETPNYTLWSFTHEGDEAQMFLCEDNVIMLTNVLNGSDKYTSYNRLGRNEYGLSTLNMIETVFAIDGTEWFTGLNYEDSVPITGEEAENIISGYKLEEVEPRIFLRK